MESFKSSPPTSSEQQRTPRVYRPEVKNEKTLALLYSNKDSFTTESFKFKYLEVQQSSRSRLYMLDLILLDNATPIAEIVNQAHGIFESIVSFKVSVYDHFYNFTNRLVIHFKSIRQYKTKIPTPAIHQTAQEPKTIPALMSLQIKKPSSLDVTIKSEQPEQRHGDPTTHTFDGKNYPGIVIRTSKAVNTESVDPPLPISNPSSYTAVPLDYKKINSMQLQAYLTKPDVYESVRVLLAYLINFKSSDQHINGQTYLSVSTKLRSMGFPHDDKEISELFYDYCGSMGFSSEAVDADLTTYGHYLRTTRSVYLSRAEKALRERFPAGPNPSIRYPYNNIPGRCDPDICCVT